MLKYTGYCSLPIIPVASSTDTVLPKNGERIQPLNDSKNECYCWIKLNCAFYFAFFILVSVGSAVFNNAIPLTIRLYVRPPIRSTQNWLYKEGFFAAICLLLCCIVFTAAYLVIVSKRLRMEFAWPPDAKALLMAFNIRPLVLSGPSGGGKSTIITKAMHDYPHAFALSVSHTTRAPRPGEQNGVHYWFSDKESVEKMIEAGDFLEHASFGGNIYGTSKAYFFVQTRHVGNSAASQQAEERLRARKTETEESLKKRLKHAEEDLNAVASDPTLFDYIIVNDDLERAYKEFIDAIDAELKLVDNHRLR
ncbi:Guanylate kinase [Toxocara canis]|uniref:Guanylate kinase n=1 Tax=Toxocara canis TaxID=6265 RepID=A0A0B2UZZ1_TOXCA|nr:Guanylate kinase [Toxocara canis]